MSSPSADPGLFSGVRVLELAQWIFVPSTAALLADLGADVRVAVHYRFVKPFLDLTLLFLGLPMVLGHRKHNIFAAAGGCMVSAAAKKAVNYLAQT